MKFLDLFRRKKKKYVKSPINGKVVSISGGIVKIEDKVLKKMDGTMIQPGQIVKRGQIIGFRK